MNQDVFPGYAAPFIRRPRERDNGDEAVPEREARLGLFGLLPHWAKDTKLTKSTYNARAERLLWIGWFPPEHAAASSFTLAGYAARKSTWSDEQLFPGIEAQAQ